MQTFIATILYPKGAGHLGIQSEAFSTPELARAWGSAERDRHRTTGVFASLDVKAVVMDSPSERKAAA